LQAAGFQVRALYRTTSPTKREVHDSLHWVAGRLEDTGSLERLLEGADTVIHCAGVVRGVEWRHFKKVNTDGVARMVRAAKKMHPSPRFLLLSSLAAREPHLSHYAASKRQGEDLLKSESDGLDWNILRPPAVYGPGDREIAPLFRMMRHGIALQAAPAASRFSMLYIEDLAEAILALCEQDAWHKAVFELHDGRPGGYDWPEVVQTVSRVLGRPVARLQVPRNLLRAVAAVNQGAARLCGYAPMLSRGKVRELTHHDWTCDNAAIGEATGWQPRRLLEEGIQKTLVALGILSAETTRKTKEPRHADL
jgi:nucleoside-diphosphate-sugar epimerase